LRNFYLLIIIQRYPNELAISEEDMRRAISYAKSVQKFILNVIEKTEQEKQQKEKRKGNFTETDLN